MRTRGRWIILGAIAAVAAAISASAFAGTGINDVFNLGVDNSVDAQSQLKGTTATPQLKINNLSATDAAIGVLGLHNAATGNGAALQGDTNSKSAGANGVAGRVLPSGSAGDSNGVKGLNNGAGRGVYGQSTSGTGVYGNSKNQYGVWGIGSYGVVAGGSQGGVWASTANGAGSGIYGENTNGGRGLFGRSLNGGGTGVYGEGATYGGQFVSQQQNGGAGAWGEVWNGSGDGARGEAPEGTGVRGVGKWGGIFKGNRDAVGLHGLVSGTGTGVVGQADVGGVGIRGKADSSTYTLGYAGLFQGEVDVQGYLKLRYQQGAPPSGDCLYTYQRGRTLVVTNGTNIWLYFCGASGWRYIYFG